MSELKPCPFCSDRAEAYKDGNPAYSASITHWQPLPAPPEQAEVSDAE